jgi:tetratricopeptide (TPR) repeat protein
MRRVARLLAWCVVFSWALLALSCRPREPELYGKAILLVERGRYAEAQKLLTDRLREHPEDDRARGLLIRVHGVTGNLGLARDEAARLAERLGPSSPRPHIELGHALELAHRYDEALDLYDQAAEVAPRDAAGPREGGLRAAAWGEYELARPRLEEAIRRAPRDAALWHALGVVCLGLKAVDDAEHAYRSGLMADPHALENRVGLATVALLRDDPAEALREYDLILAERPGFGDAWLGRSWALLRLGRLAEAEEALAKAEQNRGDRAVIARQRRALAAAKKHLGVGNSSNKPPPTP